VQEKAEGGVQISAVNPLESMKAVENENLKAIAGEVAERILKVLGKV